MVQINICKSINLFSEEQKIKFQDANDFNKILYSHSVAPHRPTILQTIASSILIYLDVSKQPTEVHWLHLYDSKPKAAAAKYVIPTQLSRVHDMCVIQDADKQLFVVAADIEGLFAFNIETGNLEWKVDENVPGMEQIIDANGVTHDGRGHLFVADRNNGCVQMFSLSDGQYLGPLKKGLETISDPGSIHWNAETSSLVVACYLNGKWQLNIINVQYLCTLL